MNIQGGNTSIKRLTAAIAIAITIATLGAAAPVLANATVDVPADTIFGSNCHLTIVSEGLVYASCRYTPKCIDHLTDSEFAHYDTIDSPPYPTIQMAPLNTYASRTAAIEEHTVFVGQLQCERDCGFLTTTKPGRYY